MGTVYKIKRCEECHEEHFMHHRQKICKYCKNVGKMAWSVTCKCCGKEFTTHKTRKKFCDKTCRKTFEHDEYMRRKNEDYD